jgi:DNA-binding response OmpR family regulator
MNICLWTTYDLVMLDLKMPKIDGFELYNEIRKVDSRTKVRFITAADKTTTKSR